MSDIPNGWLTPDQFAASLERPVRWVQDHIRTGAIPTVPIGRYRYITPACIEQMERNALGGSSEMGDDWGRVTRGTKRGAA
ncbi:helix-turn-helix domain-containing protein [Ornithinimicrobium sp. LYQ92]|uniref:helix-turn-helix domain-containing protein n=1 Tax=Serinicoccus sp. LYQ92 TaxID=3378798 RepID=UPI003853E430